MPNEHVVEGAKPTRALTWPVYAFCALVPLVFTLLLLTWFERIGGRSHFSGLYQADMPTYLCSARVAARSPTLLSYASPWDLRAQPRALLVQWPISLLGGLLAIGLSPAVAEELIRLGAGFLMFVLLAHIARLLFPNRVMFWSSLITLSLGGGVAWVSVLWHRASLLQHPDAGRLRRAILHVERDYYWWCVDLFRNLLYPLELIQHCVVFAYLLAVMQGRRRLALVFLLLGATSSPFVAVMLFGIHFMCCVPDFKQHIREHAVAGLLAALFVFHYKVLMAHDPVLGSVMAQHQHSPGYGDPLSWKDTLTGHGLVLLALPALLFDRRFRASLYANRAVLPIIAMTACSLALIHHSRLPRIAPMMPKHFARGYSFVGMGLLLFLWLQELALRGLRTARAASVAALLCIPLTLPDNLSFAVNQYKALSSPRLLLWPKTTEALLEHLRSVPGHLRILSDETVISGQVCAMTNHMTVVGAAMMTPDFPTRSRRARRFLSNPADERALGDWHIDGVLVPRKSKVNVRSFATSAAWKLSFQNAQWTLFMRER